LDDSTLVKQAAAVFVINLLRRPERLQAVAGQLDALNLVWHRIDAVDGLDGIPRDCGVRFGRTVLYGELSPAEQACVLSHRKAWQTFLDSDQAQAIFLEDDVALGDEFARLAIQGLQMPEFAAPVKIETSATRRKDVILLGKPFPEAKRAGWAVHRLHSSSLGSAGYVLSREAAAAMLRRTRRIRRAVDVILFDPVPLLPWRRAAVLVPQLVWQIDTENGTDIGEGPRRPSDWWRKLARRTIRRTKLMLARLIYRADPAATPISHQTTPVAQSRSLRPEV